MSLTKLTENLNNVSSLPDKPSLQADELKAEFDKAGNSIKEYINSTLTEELDKDITNLTKKISANENSISDTEKSLNNSKLDKTKFITTENTDLNNYKEEGTYYFETNVTPLNIPAGNNGWLKVMNRGKDEVFIKQIWYRMGTPNSNDTETYVRTYGGNNTWSSWTKYITKIDMDNYYNKTESDNKYQLKGNFKVVTATTKYETLMNGNLGGASAMFDIPYPTGFNKNNTAVIFCMVDNILNNPNYQLHFFDDAMSLIQRNTFETGKPVKLVLMKI